MMDENEFPALALSTKENIVALLPIARALKSKKPPPRPIGKIKDESLEAVKPELACPIQVKGKPVLLRDRQSCLQLTLLPLLQAPLDLVLFLLPLRYPVLPLMRGQLQYPPISPVPLTTASAVKQGPRIIRIVSSSSSIL
ncbi:hypothetical protein L873DRAFT_1296656 [Choiromyces venosus 120613-1]|uniref:Uncharacterized protein n=1 Tax=Choiromyces venosus 120613-1 TaxID=1336337 RepID=A0A3N4JBS2_9PEZI|nr:hypothetical protein L873DRAFT_1296656 [Choiromyces venosus 120613-1]